MTIYTGFRPDPHYDRTGHIGSAWRKKVRVGSSVPESSSLANYYEPTNQSANDCLAQTGRQMARIRAAVQGLDIPQLSSYFPYYNLRARHKWMRSEALRDGGGYPRSMIWAFAKFGTCREIDWPSNSLFDVNVQPRSMQYIMAKNYKVSIRPIYDSGDDLVWRIKDSIAKGMPVGVALQIDKAFHDGNQPLVIEPPSSPMQLGHMVTGIGYDQNGLMIGNSWGYGWGKKGTAVISWNYVKRSLYVCDCDRVTVRASA